MDNNPAGNSYGAGNNANAVGTGIYGASYNTAAGIYKNLGYLPAGYDGVDNNYNGMIDDSAEGVTPPGFQHPRPGHGQPGQFPPCRPPAPHGAVGDALRDPRRGGWPPGLDLQPRRIHGERSQGHRRRRPARVRRCLGSTAPVLPLAHPLPHRHPEGTGGRLLGLHPGPACLFRSRAAQPALQDCFRDRRAGPVRSQPAASGTDVVVAARWKLQLAVCEHLWWRLAGNNGWHRGKRRGRCLRMLPFHRLTEPFGHTGASVYYWDRGSLVPYRPAFLYQAPDTLRRPRPSAGSQHFPDSNVPDASHLLAVENNAMSYYFDFTQSLAVRSGNLLTLPNGPFISPNTTDTSYPRLPAPGEWAG